MSKNWYPVINFETCINCGACVNQCNNGVYDKTKAPNPNIIFTDGCIDGCHGCGNLCPTASITYHGENIKWLPPNLSKCKTSNNEKGCSCGGNC